MEADPLDLIVSWIVELSLGEKSDDPVRNIYSVMVDLDFKVIRIMEGIREQERVG